MYFFNNILLLLITITLGIIFPSKAQQADIKNIPQNSSELDTTRLLSDQPVKSPLGAVLRSAVLPGWGQFYNRKIFKGLVAFSINTFFVSRIFFYHNRWRKTGNGGFRNKRNSFTWYFGFAYLLTMVDAYVDAYLYGFDEAIKISLVPDNHSPTGTVVVRCRIAF